MPPPKVTREQDEMTNSLKCVALGLSHYGMFLPPSPTAHSLEVLLRRAQSPCHYQCCGHLATLLQCSLPVMEQKAHLLFTETS